MTSQTHSRWTVKIVPDNAASRDKAICDAVAHRAYRIFETRCCEPGHDREDWRLAESEILRPLACGFYQLHDRIRLIANVSCFEGEITARLEPRRLTLSGKARSHEGDRVPDTRSPDLHGEVIFRFINLPAGVDPIKAEVRFNGCMLEMWLFKAGAVQSGRVLAKAA